MTCHSDKYKEDQPMGWPSLSRDAMPNRAWEGLRFARKPHGTNKEIKSYGRRRNEV